MTATAVTFSPQLAKLLEPRGRSLVEEIFDPDLQDRVVKALEACASTLEVLDSFDLENFEMVEADLQDLSVWNDVAPKVRDALVSVNKLITTIEACFPPPPVEAGVNEQSLDLDAAFDELGSDEPANHKRRGDSLDMLVQEKSEDSVDLALAGICSMLRQDLTQLGTQLRSPGVVTSRWKLLGELQEFQARVTQAVEAIAAAILQPCRALDPSAPEKMEELFPRYATELERSLRLRNVMSQMAKNLQGAVEVLAKAETSMASNLHRALLTRLEQFGRTTEYRQMWARDKREIILARVRIRAWDPKKDTVSSLRQEVDGLTRFVEVLRDAIGRRPEVEAYDKGTRHTSAQRAH
jgi:hypothetical protein